MPIVILIFKRDLQCMWRDVPPVVCCSSEPKVPMDPAGRRGADLATAAPRWALRQLQLVCCGTPACSLQWCMLVPPVSPKTTCGHQHTAAPFADDRHSNLTGNLHESLLTPFSGRLVGANCSDAHMTRQSCWLDARL